MEKIFAIYDSDLIYATRFMEYFKKKKEFNFEISAFTKKESLEEFLQFHQIEILLLGEQASPDDLPIEKIKYIYQFTDDPNEEKRIDQPLIFKYQSVEVIMAEVFNNYIKRENVSQLKSNSKTTKIISIYSPISGIEKLAFAWSLSILLSEQKKVLFVPMDLLPVQLLSFVNNTNQFLSEFIYYLKENSNIIIKMRSLLSYSGNLSYLVGLAHGFDLLALNNGDIRRWGDELKINTDYQTIIFYIGGYTEAMVELVNISDSVIIPKIETNYESMMLQEWDRQMEQIGVDTNHDKFQNIQIQEEDRLGKENITLQELTNSLTWSIAKKYINS
ncbi:MAG: hypothetical protein K0S01_2013 [Herbinix sp.]|nr:hypothetical protein [Herbinix sp.]